MQHSPTRHYKTTPNLLRITLTLKVPEKLQLYGLYVYYVVHICDVGMLRVKRHIEGQQLMITRGSFVHKHMVKLSGACYKKKKKISKY